MALAVTVVTVPAPAAGAGSPCAEVVSISPGDDFAGWPGRPGESFCYRVDVDSPGALLVGAQTPALTGAAPTLRLRERAGSVLVTPCGAAHLALWIDQPGAYVFEVAARDPRQELAEHTFTSRFAAEADAVSLEPGDFSLPSKDGDDDEIDPILNPVTVPGSEPKDGDDDEIDPILNPAATPEDTGSAVQVRVRGDGLLLVDFGRRAVLVHAGERVVIAGSTRLRFYDLCPSDLSW